MEEKSQSSANNVNKKSDLRPSNDDANDANASTELKIDPLPEKTSASIVFTNSPYLNRTGGRYCCLANLKDTNNPVDGWNAVMQLLYTCRPIRNYFINNQTFGPIHSHIGAFLAEMQRNASTAGQVVPMSSSGLIELANKEQPREPLRNVCLDNDVHLILKSLLESAHEEVNQEQSGISQSTDNDWQAWQDHLKSTNNSYLSQLMQCQIETELVFKHCGHRCQSWDVVWMLQLQMPPATCLVSIPPIVNDLNKFPSLMDCLKLMEKGEMISANLNCTVCQKVQQASKHQKVSRVSSIVLVHLRRFKVNGDKDPTVVQLKPQIELAGQSFELLCAILHRGNRVNSGQYSTLIRESQDQWVELADETITKGIRDLQAYPLLDHYAYVVVYKFSPDVLLHETNLVSAFQLQQAIIKSTQDHESIEDKFAKWWSICKSTGESGAVPKDDNLDKCGLALAINNEPYGYCGLFNLGLSCYANSCLQVLYTATRIRRYLIEHPECGPFHNSISKLFLRMETESSRLKNPSIQSISIKPDQFMEQFRKEKPSFLPHQMHDAQEFFSILIESIHQEANQAKRIKIPDLVEEPKTAMEAWQCHVRNVDNSYLSSLLMGQLESTLRCLTCGNVNKSWTAIWQIQLQLESDCETLSTAVTFDNQEKKQQEEKMLTFKDCFKEYTDEEILKEDCAPLCARCKSRQPAAKAQTICRVPHYLLIHVKRFAYDGTKIHCRVALDEHLQLCSQQFVLLSVVNHQGTQDVGHYFTLHRERDNQWVRLDDQLITRGLNTKVATEQLQRHAYLCLYKAVKRDHQSADHQNQQRQAANEGSVSKKQEMATKPTNNNNKDQ